MGNKPPNVLVTIHLEKSVLYFFGNVEMDVNADGMLTVHDYGKGAYPQPGQVIFYGTPGAWLSASLETVIDAA